MAGGALERGPQPGEKRRGAERILARVFYGAALLCFVWAFVSAALQLPGNRPATLALALGLGLGLCLLHRAAAPFIDRLPPRRVALVAAIGLGLYALALLVMGRLLLASPMGDLKWTLEAVSQVVERGRLEGYYNHYLQQYPNNFALFLLLLALTRLLVLLGIDPGTGAAVLAGPDTALYAGSDAALYAGAVLNAAVMVLALFFLWRLAGLLLKSQSAALLALLLGLLFVPYLLWVPYFYTDTLALPFAPAAFYLYLKGRENRRWAAAWRYLACGAVLLAGTLMKGSLLLALVAVLVHLALTAPVKGWLLPSGCILGVFLALNAAFTICTNHLPWFDPAGRQDAQNPVWMWMAMASHQAEGFWMCEECWAIRAIPGYGARSAAAFGWMVENYAAYSPAQLAGFLTRKAGYAWGDGTYEVFEFLREARHGNWTHAFIMAGGALHMPLRYSMQATQQLLLAGLSAGLFAGLRRGRFTGVSLVHILLLGVLLFFPLWENRPRYILAFTPLLILAAAGGLVWISGRLPRIINRPGRKNPGPAEIYAP